MDSMVEREEDGRVLSDPALVSDQAALRLAPPGFDPSRWARLKWAWKDRRSSERCPWCRQWNGGAFRMWERDPFLDLYTCSTCGGTSVWRWEMCMIYIGAVAAPQPAWPNADYYDVAAARLRCRDSDRSGEAVETTGSTEGESAGRDGIAPTSSALSDTEGR